MTFITTLLFSLLIVMPAFAQAPTVPIGANVIVEWDAPANAADSDIARYEVQLDTAATWTVANGVFSATGVNRHTIGTGLKPGAHQFRMRACTTTTTPQCGPELLFTFTVQPAVPGAPRNPRLGTPNVALRLEQAFEIAQSYSYIVNLRRLNDRELIELAARYPYPEVTREGVLSFLDTQVPAPH